MSKSMSHQKDAVKSGYWPLYRYKPTTEDGQPFSLDSKKPTIPIKDFVSSETRFAILQRTDPARAEELAELAQADADERRRNYEQLVEIHRQVPSAPEHARTDRFRRPPPHHLTRARSRIPHRRPGLAHPTRTPPPSTATRT